jgi:ATP-dependent DNA helicase RecG
LQRDFSSLFQRKAGRDLFIVLMKLLMYSEIKVKYFKSNVAEKLFYRKMAKYKTILKDELVKLSNRKEDLFFDRKGAGIQPKDLQKTIISFANSEGGKIYVGIDDEGHCNGFGEMSKYDSLVKDGIFAINPPIFGLEHKFFEYEGKFILSIEIPKSERVHETSKSEVYLRIGACNKKLSQQEIQALKYKKGELKYEEETRNVDLAALTAGEYLKGYIRKTKVTACPIDFLVSNGYVYNQKPKVLSLVCFHDKPQNILKCGIKINRYEMNKTSRKYAYERARKKFDQSIFGPLEKLIREGLNFIFDTLAGMNVKYPKEAIVEGFVNALVHRDYSINEDVIVNMYDNKIEIISPGGFPGKISEYDLNARKITRCLRNPAINNILFSISAVEKDFHDRLNQDQGEGVMTIFSAMKKVGLADPEFKEIDNKVYLSLKHESAQSYESKILDYLEKNNSIANREARVILGEEDKEKVKNVFSKLEKMAKIERVDLNASRSKTRYRKTDRVPIINDKNINEQQIFDIFKIESK